MAETGIEWTNITWNCVVGCDKCSEGCVNCYALRMAARLEGNPAVKHYSGIVHTVGKRKPHPEWTGAVRLVPELLGKPLRWRKPRRVFVNSMSDLFHEALSNEAIAAVFGVMAACPRHTFQVLTKRADRMRDWFEWLAHELEDDHAPPPTVACGIYAANLGSNVDYLGAGSAWPLPNVWLGVSAENQRRADERIPHLLATPAAVRFVSYEPALGPIDFTPWLAGAGARRVFREAGGLDLSTIPAHLQPPPMLHWIIMGSESGPGARPADIQWFRDVIRQRDRWAGPDVALFLKQWTLGKDRIVPPGVGFTHPITSTTKVLSLPELDGRQWVEFPEAA